MNNYLNQLTKYFNIPISILLTLAYIGYYQLPTGFYSNTLFWILQSIPIYIAITIICTPLKNKYLKGISIILFLLITLFAGFVNFIGNSKIVTVIPTDCGSNIYTTYESLSFLTGREMLVESHNNGLYYTLHDISSDRSSDGVQNFSQNYGFRYNRKNFYKEGDFEKYRDCLPNVSKICPNYFWISISTDGDGCKDL
jgi:hypothetical protein